ncbi:MAG: Asp-tRNA(Asn)/Glu-tRNA(Gln) amidotransferase GatCAB subunit C, partial [Armatimonadetes bacterium]|nr:Asp-tRNA(Asn)/Glu-tRNA(Gln) amidotransferase GatCAB subunit C [Armatimonadota bacterium]
MERRSKYRGEVAVDDIGSRLILQGWVQRVRDHGGLIFIDLRDRVGVVQCVCDPHAAPDVFKLA